MRVIQPLAFDGLYEDLAELFYLKTRFLEEDVAGVQNIDKLLCVRGAESSMFLPKNNDKGCI